MAWENEPWVQESADVRVCQFGFAHNPVEEFTVNGLPVESIGADLSGNSIVKPSRLPENKGRSFQGLILGGGFEVDDALATAWLAMPNPMGVSNEEVLFKFVGPDEILEGAPQSWIIDFGSRGLAESEEYVAPFDYVKQKALAKASNEPLADKWWRLTRPRPKMRAAICHLGRILVTFRTSKHRIWVWLPKGILPDTRAVVVVSESDYDFGVLQSSIHTIWANKQTSKHGVGNDYNYVPNDCFDTFPFPELDAGQRAEVEKWARYIVELREHLLTTGAATNLTGLYNVAGDLRKTADATNPVTGLNTAHDRLDQAVATAYRLTWPPSQDEVIAKLLEINRERSGGEGTH